jgi:proton-dependent oligopeptide transporter, POT family
MRGHPRGLVIVVLTGMWEVFALFGMRTVLVFYLIQDLAFAPATAVQIYSLSTAAAMGMSLVGAVLADRVIGVRRAVIIGAIGMAAGHLLLVIPQLLFPALALIVAANGLFKPALVSQMNRLYDTDDPRRDRSFTIYKAGCNGAAIFAPVVTGLVGKAHGWPVALAICGVGMVIACITFLAGSRSLVESAHHQVAARGAVTAPTQGGGALSALLLVLLGSALFWSAHGQQGGTIAVWAESAVDRVVSVHGRSFEIPATWFQSVNPIIIVCATPIINWWWTRRRALGGGSDELRKMSLGAVFLTASLVVVALGSYSSGEQRVASVWLFGALLLLTLGELYFDALGQAFVLRLATPRTATTFVSFWFLTLAVGFAGAGWLANAWGRVSAPTYFLLAAGVAIGAAVLVTTAMRRERRQK